MKKITQTSTVHTSKRTYFVNKGTMNEEDIIEITESKKVSPQKFERKKILIYKEDLDTVIEAVRNIIKKEDTK